MAHALGHGVGAEIRQHAAEMRLDPVADDRRASPPPRLLTLPSTGVVPVGLPSPSSVIAATFSSASLSFSSQRFFSAAPRS